jgi:hypothetical protein
MQCAAAAATAIGKGFGLRRWSAKMCGTEWDGNVRLFPPHGTLSSGGSCSESNVLAIVDTLLIFPPPPAFDAPRCKSLLTKT